VSDAILRPRRSVLYMPGANERALEKAKTIPADALILDLEDSVAFSEKEGARRTTAAFLAEARQAAERPRLFVRVNSLSTGLTDADLDGVMAGAPDGIMLPKAVGGPDVAHLGAKLAVREAEHGLDDGGTRIVAIATETAASLFVLGGFAGASRRLAGLAWGAEDLSADLGAEANRDEAGLFTEPFRLARNLMLFAAAAAEVDAVDTVFTNFRDPEGLARECREAQRDGFVAKLAIHPGQVPVINEAFTPTPEAVARARAIVDAFAQNPGAGVVGLGGEMIDQPHLKRSERLLRRLR
jgi:citrate lyase subunit beta / citryl-CoA lyase